MKTASRCTPQPARPSDRSALQVEGLPLPPVRGVDFPTFADCYCALHGAPRS